MDKLDMSAQVPGSLEFLLAVHGAGSGAEGAGLASTDAIMRMDRGVVNVKAGCSSGSSKLRDLS